MESSRIKISTLSIKSGLQELRRANDNAGRRHSAAISLLEAYRTAASVLAGFDPDTLNAYPPGPSDQLALQDFLRRDAIAVDEPGTSGYWRLRTGVRRASLRKLETREAMQAVRAVNHEAAHADSYQRMLDRVIEGAPIDLETLQRPDLVALATARNWLEGILDDLPDRESLQQRLARIDLLAPMEKLAGVGGKSFVGRESELQVLRDYVGVLPANSTIGAVWRFIKTGWYSLSERPPLMVYGPGGVGKSTLLAKFILDHANPDYGPKLPFIYIDFDRKGVSAKQPLTLLVEAAFQLGSQFPHVEDQARKFQDDVNYALQRVDVLETTKSNLDSDRYVSRFAELTDRLSDDETPILMALDTFEEVQYLGEEPVDLIWNLLETLQRQQPRLRIVLSGRANLDKRSTERVFLEDLDHRSAEAFFVRQLESSSSDDMLKGHVIEELVDLVGHNPLSLKLASRVIADEGVDALRSMSSRRYLFFRIRVERIQAMLYDRILSHLHTKDSEHGEKLLKLAHPGLVVRRLTPEVIEEVLAEPCGLELDGSAEAKVLFDLLAKEAALVDVDPNDPEKALRHRTDVRRLMLPDLLAQHSDKAREIDRRAIAYYASRTEANRHPAMLAEEIYHRLRLGEDISAIDERWDDSVIPSLEGALDELGPEARVYLSAKLGVTPDIELLLRADLDQWEAHAARRATTYLAAGKQELDKALKVLRERRARSPGSPLYHLEAETLRALGNLDEAIDVAQAGLRSLADMVGGTLVTAVELELLVSLIEESRHNFKTARDFAERALAHAEYSGERIAVVRALVAKIRLLRKTGGLEQSGRKALVKRILEALDEDVVREIRDRPALVREVVAEVGADAREFLKLGVEMVGLELLQPEQRSDLANTLKQWDKQSAHGRGGEIAEAIGVDQVTSKSDGWLDFVEKNSGSRLNKTLQKLLARFNYNEDVQQDLTKHFRHNVDSAIEQGVDRGLIDKF